MDGWHLILYAFVIYLAVRTLVALMRAHEMDLRQKARQEALATRKPPGNAAGSGPIA